MQIERHATTSEAVNRNTKGNMMNTNEEPIVSEYKAERQAFLKEEAKFLSSTAMKRLERQVCILEVTVECLREKVIGCAAVTLGHLRELVPLLLIRRLSDPQILFLVFMAYTRLMTERNWSRKRRAEFVHDMASAVRMDLRQGGDFDLMWSVFKKGLTLEPPNNENTIVKAAA